jgi:ATP-dependent DNA ligase
MARAYTRSGLDWSERFADIVKEAATLDVRSALLDGEAVVMDEHGRSNFQALQNALKGAPATVDFFAFDLLELDGEDLTGLPLTERKAKLRAVLPEGGWRIRYSDQSSGTARASFTVSAMQAWRALSRRRRMHAMSARDPAAGSRRSASSGRSSWSSVGRRRTSLVRSGH